MTAQEKHLILQACAFAREFIKEADRASGDLKNETHYAAAQLYSALRELPKSIEGCACECVEFHRFPVQPEVDSILNKLPSFGRYFRRLR